MYKKTIRNERGDLSFFTIFVILAIIMLMSFLLLFASVKINCMNIRKRHLPHQRRHLYCKRHRDACRRLPGGLGKMAYAPGTHHPYHTGIRQRGIHGKDQLHRKDRLP